MKGEILSTALLLIGLMLIVGMQFAIAGIAFKRSAISGLMCIFLPLYVYVFANRSIKNPWFMRLWYAGIGLLALGGIAAS